MKFTPSVLARLVFTVFLTAVVLFVGLTWPGDHSSSWASPAQYPHAQTVPPRPPKVTPTATAFPLPNEPTDEPEQPDSSSDDEDGGEGDGDREAPPAVENPNSANEPAPEFQKPVDQPAQSEARPAQDQRPLSEPPAGAEQGESQPLSKSGPSADQAPGMASPNTAGLPRQTDDKDPAGYVEPALETGADAAVKSSEMDTVVNEGQQAEVDPSSTSAERPAFEAGLPVWVYGLGVGLILILIGVFSVKRS